MIFLIACCLSAFAADYVPHWEFGYGMTPKGDTFSSAFYFDSKNDLKSNQFVTSIGYRCFNLHDEDVTFVLSDENQQKHTSQIFNATNIPAIITATGDIYKMQGLALYNAYSNDTVRFNLTISLTSDDRHALETGQALLFNDGDESVAFSLQGLSLAIKTARLASICQK